MLVCILISFFSASLGYGTGGSSLKRWYGFELVFHETVNTEVYIMVAIITVSNTSFIIVEVSCEDIG